MKFNAHKRRRENDLFNLVVIGLFVCLLFSFNCGLSLGAVQSIESGARQKPLPPSFESTPWVLPDWLRTEATSGQASGQRKATLAGSWAGFYTHNKHFYRITMKLDDLADVEHGFAGPIQFFQLRKNRDGSVKKEPTAVGIARAVFDVTGRSVDLNVTKIEGSGYGEDDTLFMDGVIALQPDRIAGLCYRQRQRTRSDRYPPRKQPVGNGFVLARDIEDQKSLVAKAYRFENLHIDLKKKYRGQQLVARTDGKIHQQIIQWASRQDRDYPRAGMNNMQTQKIFPLAANLFEDEHFTSFFGVRFDELDDRDSSIIGRTIAVRGKGQAESVRGELAKCSYLSSYFGSSGSVNRREVISHLLPRREIRRWRDQRLGRIEKLGSDSDSAKEVRQLLMQFRTHLKALAPFEREEAIKSIEGRINQVAPQTLNASVAKLLDREPDEFFFYSMESWRAASNLPLDLIDEAHFKRLQGAVDGRIDSVLRVRLREDVERISKVGEEFESIKKLQDFYRQIHRIYGRHDAELGLTDRPDFEAAARYACELYSYLLSENLPQVLEAIKSKATHQELLAYKRSLFALPLLGGSKTKERIDLVIEQQLASIDREAFLAMFSLGEQALMDDRDRIQVPKVAVPPTDDEIRLAILRSHADCYGAMTSPDTFEYSVSTVLPVPADGSVPLGRMSLRISEVKQERRPTASSEDPRIFKVTYRYRATLSASTIIGGREAKKMANALGALLGQFYSEPQTETFVLTETGWRSPSVKEKILRSGPVALGKFYQSLIKSNR